jgi:predicted membrane-bound mannosyltransferase
MIGSLVYALCALTCVVCAGLLWRAHQRSRMRLLFWSALCFAIMAISNALLFVDLVMVPGSSLLTLRSLVSQVAYLTLLYGLIFETK